MSPTQVTEAKRRLREIIRKSDKLGVTREEIMKLSTISKLRALTEKRSGTFSWVWQGSGWVLAIAAAAFLCVAALFVCYGGAPASDVLRQQQYQALAIGFRSEITLPTPNEAVIRLTPNCLLLLKNKDLIRLNLVFNLFRYLSKRFAPGN
ncbi:UNVERIFIED_CONTAM: hypothetical protein PYX00_003385 [Menopon gallinae]|uniref:Uncharacterized protein n=1 Tax=Menopon gallinae TaxID=328185 RepID=A0AAW2I0V9_9NEOP